MFLEVPNDLSSYANKIGDTWIVEVSTTQHDNSMRLMLVVTTTMVLFLCSWHSFHAWLKGEDGKENNDENTGQYKWGEWDCGQSSSIVVRTTGSHKVGENGIETFCYCTSQQTWSLLRPLLRTHTVDSYKAKSMMLHCPSYDILVTLHCQFVAA